METFRTQKETLRLTYEQEERNHKRQIVDHLAVSKTLHSEKESVQSKCQSLEEELRQTLSKKIEIQEENNRLKKELDKTIGMMEEMAHKLNIEISNSQIIVLKQKADYERQLEDLNHKISSLRSEKSSNQVIIQELKDKNSLQEREYLDKLRMAQEEQWSKISSLEIEKSSVIPLS